MLKKAEKPENVRPPQSVSSRGRNENKLDAITGRRRATASPHTVQDSHRFGILYPDGLCRLDDRLFSKT